MSLRGWQKNSWLVAHETSKEEIAALLAIVERDLANAGVNKHRLSRYRHWRTILRLHHEDTHLMS